MQIKLTRDRLTREKANTFYFLFYVHVDTKGKKVGKKQKKLLTPGLIYYLTKGDKLWEDD